MVTPPVTRLQRALAEPGTSRRPTALDAFRRARRRFLAPERIDMTALADDLGVNRVTLYRWVGSRDQLHVEVVWSLTRDSLRAIGREVRPTGAERVVQVTARFLAAVTANAGMRRWLGEEAEHAVRLLTRPEHGFRPRLVDAVHALLAEEADGGRLALPAALPEVADVLVRLVESCTYLDLVAGETRAVARAEPVLRMLLVR
jgi:AcrR family transcriptional regulator